MQIAIAIAAAIFIYLSGRNDGGPLLAIPLQVQSRLIFVPIIFLYLSVPLVVLAGRDRVAASLEGLITPTMEADTVGYSVLVTLVAVLATLAISTALNAPNSITLALIGSLTGVALAGSGEVPWSDLIRIVLLGLAAPFVAALLAFTIRKIHIATVPGATYVWTNRRHALQLGYFVLLYAYAANDGQKVLFAVALALGMTVGEVTEMGWIIFVAAVLFIFGAVRGAVKSGRFIRHGIARPSTSGLVVTEYSAGAAVLAGSFLGAPLSMTQSLSGALAGTGLATSPLAVYWNGLRLVAMTWVWTLPVSALLAYLLSLGAGAVATLLGAS